MQDFFWLYGVFLEYPKACRLCSTLVKDPFTVALEFYRVWGLCQAINEG